MEHSDDLEVPLIHLRAALSTRKFKPSDWRVVDEAVSQAALTGWLLLLKPSSSKADLDFGGMQTSFSGASFTTI